MGKSKKKSKKSKAQPNKPNSIAWWPLAIVGLFFGVIFGITLSKGSESVQEASFPKPSKELSISQIIERAKNLPCEDKEPIDRCASFASRGNCEISPGWMQVMCAASCNSCEMLDFSKRCDPERLNLTLEPAFKPGEMSEMFETLQQRFPSLEIKYLSKPPNGPYIVQFDNFLADEEVEAMISNVGLLKRSTDQGKVDETTGIQSQTVSKTRTSENAWCTGQCASNPIIKRVNKRIAEVVQVDENNFEAFQMLRYENGQEYKRHHDMSVKLSKHLQGPRVLTFFLYLSDVTEGGGTRFTDLNPTITMMPKKGSAILWPSVLDEDLMALDPMTYHQALPVIQGTKYAANSWIHLYNYKIPNLYGCTGSFS